ncbi:MAG: hypothetical protein ACKN9T_12995 [Candidatus Methylumidiphilus sp.]
MSEKTLSREFSAPWPAVLVEMKDFADLARLSEGRDCKAMRIAVTFSKNVPPQAFAPAAYPFAEFKASLAALSPDPPVVLFHEHSFHRVDIKIQR